MYVVLIERLKRANKSCLIKCCVVSFPKFKETGIRYNKKCSVEKKITLRPYAHLCVWLLFHFVCGDVERETQCTAYRRIGTGAPN